MSLPDSNQPSENAPPPPPSQLSVKQSTEWRETKREYNVSPNGELVPIKVTHELYEKPKLERKDKIDIFFRTIAALAIAVPFIIFLAQRSAEKQKQKELLTFDVYSQVSQTIHSMYSANDVDEKFLAAKTKLFFELYPKLLLFNDKQIINTLETFKNEVTLYELHAQNKSCATNLSEFLFLHPTHTECQRYFRNHGSTVDDEYRDFLRKFALIDALLKTAEAGVDGIRPNSKDFSAYIKQTLAYKRQFSIYNTTMYIRLTSARDTASIKLGEELMAFDAASFKSLQDSFNVFSDKYLNYYRLQTFGISNKVDSLIRVSNIFL